PRRGTEVSDAHRLQQLDGLRELGVGLAWPASVAPLLREIGYRARAGEDFLHPPPRPLGGTGRQTGAVLEPRSAAMAGDQHVDSRLADAPVGRRTRRRPDRRRD